MSEDAIPEAQYHLAIAHEALRAYNTSGQKLRRAWGESESSFPLDEIVCGWMPLIESGEQPIDLSFVKSVAKEVSKRRKQLEKSRTTDAEQWDARLVRDLEHSSAETALNRAAEKLKDVRDSL